MGGHFSVNSNEIMDLGKDYQLVLKPDTFLVDGELITCTGLLSNQKRKTSRWWRD